MFSKHHSGCCAEKRFWREKGEVDQHDAERERDLLRVTLPIIGRARSRVRSPCLSVWDFAHWKRPSFFMH